VNDTPRWAADVEKDPTEADSVAASGASSAEHFEARLKALEAELLDSADLDNIQPLEPVITDLLFRDTLARIYGASGTFKSFTTLDFAGCVGTGKDWHGRATRQGGVIYLVAEGIRGIRKRVRAWEQHHQLKMTGVRFLPRPVQAMDPEWLVLIALCEKLQPALIIIDTQARVTVGIEENSNTEMGRVVHRMEQLRTATEACVLLVHHTGHDGDRSRGATAVKGALQTELGITRKGKGLHESTITLSTGKQKDDEEMGDITFGLHQVVLKGEAKEDGTPITSIVLVPLTGFEAAAMKVVEPGSAEWIADQLDQAGIPLLGRNLLQRECERLGIKASSTKLSEAIRIRKERASSGPVPKPVPDLFPSNFNQPVPESRTGQEETAGQTCPEQVGDRSRTGANPDLFPSPPSYREGTGRNTRPECTICGGPLAPFLVSQGIDVHVGC
jgi:hypothetical protein